MVAFRRDAGSKFREDVYVIDISNVMIRAEVGNRLARWSGYSDG
jgi:hypothetical protein